MDDRRATGGRACRQLAVARIADVGWRSFAATRREVEGDHVVLAGERSI
jgi:hypothetical protein